MINPRAFVDDPERVKEHLRRRHADEALVEGVDHLVALAERRSTLISERDDHRNQRNVLSKQIGQLMRKGQPEEAEAAKVSVRDGNIRIDAIESELATLEEERHRLTMGVPNLLHDDVPEGLDENDNLVLREWGTKVELVDPEAHVEVGERLGILDLERAARLSGARFAILKGAGARLERALINFFLDLHTGTHGYTEVMVPYIVHREILEGTSQLPKFEADLFRIEGNVNGADAFLIPTAEVPVTNMHRGEILDEAALPLKYACFTPCFRSEAGSAGRDVRGILRQHQFHKVEMVWITTLEHADAAHAELVSHAEACLQRLGLAYRAVLHCGGETSFGANKCIDLEVWLPSQGYREVSSCSSFLDFQARRMQLRYRPTREGKKAKPRLAATLNGSGLACGRTMVAILENYQQPDGSLIIPEALRPYMGGMEIVHPEA